jgi:hypothetical protein
LTRVRCLLHSLSTQLEHDKDDHQTEADDAGKGAEEHCQDDPEVEGRPHHHLLDTTLQLFREVSQLNFSTPALWYGDLRWGVVAKFRSFVLAKDTIGDPVADQPTCATNAYSAKDG